MGRPFFYVCLGMLDEKQRKRWAADLLDANYFFKGTLGATLGVDLDNGDVLLVSRVCPAGLDDQRFERLLENIVQIAGHWQVRLAAPAPEQAPSAVPEFFAQRA